jgi:predicted transcriptional regulator
MGMSIREDKMAEVRKLSVRLNDETVKKLEELARDQGLTLTAALQRAIATEDFVRGQIKQGGKILVEKPNKTFTEVVFR